MLLQGVVLEEGIKFRNLLVEVPKDKETSVGGPVLGSLLRVVACEDETCIDWRGSWHNSIETGNKRVGNPVQETEANMARAAVSNESDSEESCPHCSWPASSPGLTSPTMVSTILIDDFFGSAEKISFTSLIFS